MIIELIRKTRAMKDNKTTANTKAMKELQDDKNMQTMKSTAHNNAVPTIHMY